jgi:ribonuclease HII
MKKRFIIGIDEVGRGALAGPVVVAAAFLSCDVAEVLHGAKRRGLGSLKDSKKLSAKRRELWFAYLETHPSFFYAIARVYPHRIERMNISKAANHAAGMAFESLAKKTNFKRDSCAIILDGGLYLGRSGSGKTLIKADEKIPIVAMASIMAKVSRDRFMVRLHKKYPAYCFELHKGYGTALHYKAIKKHGSSPVHRLTFLGLESRM